MLDKNNIPHHVAIIMDGNGRWAKKRGLPRTAGHQKGVKVIEEIIKTSVDLGIKVLSLYAFSTENWNRPRSEINMLLYTLNTFLKNKTNELIKNNIKLVVMGDINRFPNNVTKLLIDVQDKTSQGSGLIINLALNYGSRFEIVKAAKDISRQAASGMLAIDALDEEKFSQFLYTKDLPDPDLFIRTSGEMRLSNFMLWQLSYAELYFCDKFWPDFNGSDFRQALAEYQKRERRFGGIN